MKNAVLAAVVAGTALGFADAARAVTYNLDAFVSSPAGPSDTRLSGSATPSAVTIDGTNPTVKLQTTETGNPPGTNQEKVAPFFYASTLGTPIGTLGDLGRGGLTADWLLQSRGATTPSFVANIAAFRILVDGPTAGTFAEIIWETGYQSPAPTFTAGVNYDDVNIGSGKFYARYLSTNYGEGSIGAVNPQTLAALASGASLTTGAPIFSDTTNVYGVQVAIGSDAGDYTAYVGDMNATFTSVPEPTTLAGFGLSAAGLLARRRRAANV